MENSIEKLATIYLRENYFQLLNVSLLKFVVIFYIYVSIVTSRFAALINNN